MTVLRGVSRVASYLYAAPAVGALLASLLSGWLPAVRRQGRAVLVAVAGWVGRSPCSV
jgi:hypothetical protein